MTDTVSVDTGPIAAAAVPSRRPGFMPIITFLTDFGLHDAYVAQMKGAALSICPSATLVDITHLVPHADIRSGAQLLREAAAHFPPGTIHVAVVDPGVGTARRRLIVVAEAPGSGRRAVFVGPDNGLMSMAAPRGARQSVYEITNFELLPKVREFTTFDGRDVFGPVAALLASGRQPDSFGPLINESEAPLIDLIGPEPTIERDGSITGEVTHIDVFGNAVTNIPDELLPADFTVALEDLQLSRFKNYSEIPNGTAGTLINSAGKLEIAANRESAAQMHGIRNGVKVVVKLSRD